MTTVSGAFLAIIVALVIYLTASQVDRAEPLSEDA